MDPHSPSFPSGAPVSGAAGASGASAASASEASASGASAASASGASAASASDAAAASQPGAPLRDAGAIAPLYDTAIVGGGPAGLAAALHLAWHDRRVVVIDRTTGPLFFTLELLHNVPGMPAVSGAEIQKRLRAQAREMGAELVRANVVQAAGNEGDFVLSAASGEQWRARTLLLATGVARFHPTVDGDFTPCLAYAGKGTLFYCPDCEAPEVAGKDTVVVGTGAADAAAAMALGLTRYTRRLRVLLTGGQTLSAAKAAQLAAAGIPVLAGSIHRLIAERRELHGLELDGGEVVAAEAFFVSSPAHGRTDLAARLGVEMSSDGDSAAPRSPRGDTNVPGVWVAGDLRPLTRQVAIAVGTGNIAAVMIDQHLRRQDVQSLLADAGRPRGETNPLP